MNNNINVHLYVSKYKYVNVCAYITESLHTYRNICIYIHMQVTYIDMYLFDIYVIIYHVYIQLHFCHENEIIVYTLRTKESTVSMLFCDFFVIWVFFGVGFFFPPPPTDILRRLEHDSTVN